MPQYEVTYTATYTVDATDEDDAVDAAIYEHEENPDGSWDAQEAPVITNEPDAETLGQELDRWQLIARDLILELERNHLPTLPWVQQVRAELRAMPEMNLR